MRGLRYFNRGDNEYGEKFEDWFEMVQELNCMLIAPEKTELMIFTLETKFGGLKR